MPFAALAAVCAVLAQSRPASAEAIDPCLVGTWEAKTVTFLIRSEPWTGGEGFRVTFRPDGAQIIDYANSNPEVRTPIPHDRFTYRGTARGRISTANKTATLERIEQSEIIREIRTGGATYRGKQPGLGPGGLGSTAKDNGYLCGGNSLEYKTSVAVDKRPTHALKLTRLATKGHDMAGRYPEEGP